MAALVSSTGQLIGEQPKGTVPLDRVNANPCNSQVFITPMDDILSDLSPSKRYRTPAEIRAIPNGQWETWIRGNNLPFTSFSAAADCQKTLRYVLKATLRRMKAQA